MLLAAMLRLHRGALRASLSEVHRVNLSGLLDDPGTNWLDVADLVAWLPPGCALWRSVGGPASLSEEAREMRLLEFRLRVLDWRFRGSKGKRPEPIPDPPYAHERRKADDAMRRKAEAHKRRQGRT